MSQLHDKFSLEEKSLCEKLLQECDNKGRENNPHICAVIFNKLGLLYQKKSPDKISLIQSAALLTAATVRQTTNQKFQKDLHDLCGHVLLCSNAKFSSSEILINVANSAKMRVEKLRKDVNYRLKTIRYANFDSEPVSNKECAEEVHSYVHKLQSLQQFVSTEYKSIMVFISQQCIDILGPPPCKYALVGMGSLARKEITPYSDFEHILLLENLDFKEKFSFKEYFRWYSTIFHIIIINLKETIVSNIGIPCLVDHSCEDHRIWFFDQVTIRGISFDGMMPHACKFPLGRTQKTKKKPWTTELIKPVDEMVQFLETDENLKNGYKLGDILTRTCFVEGDEPLYNKFFQTVKKSLIRVSKQRFLFLKQLEEDLKNFDIINNLSVIQSDDDINVKQIIYRSTTLFISALGRLESLDVNSGFEIIEELKLQRKINEYTALRLSLAVAVSCHVRLFHYMAQKRQDDNIFCDQLGSPEEKLVYLTKGVDLNLLTKQLLFFCN